MDSLGLSIADQGNGGCQWQISKFQVEIRSAYPGHFR
jgi:hypothetical protein